MPETVGGARVLAVVSIGGGLGAAARYGLMRAWPVSGAEFPWPTFVTNVCGCLLIGVLMTLVTDVWPDGRMIRPFLGAGVLGGFTTFSTYVVDIQHLLYEHRSGLAMVYLFSTVIAALTATCAGIAITRAFITPLGSYARRASADGQAPR